MNIVVAKIRKRGGTEVWVALSEYEGSQRLDIREYFRPDGKAEWLPAQKGISLLADAASDLTEAVEALVEAGEEEGRVATLAKSGSSEIRVGISSYQVRKFAEVRTYTRWGGEPELRPSKRGVTLNPSLVPALLKAIATAEEALGPS